MLVAQSTLTTHRTAITSADSGNDPTAWADAPAAFPHMANHAVLRVFPILNSGSLTKISLRVIVIRASDTFVSSKLEITADFTEMVDYREGYEGEREVYVKIDELTGSSPNVTLKVAGVNIG